MMHWSGCHVAVKQCCRGTFFNLQLFHHLENWRRPLRSRFVIIFFLLYIFFVLPSFPSFQLQMRSSIRYLLPALFCFLLPFPLFHRIMFLFLQILVTGSLHLVGGALSILDPGLSCATHTRHSPTKPPSLSDLVRSTYAEVSSPGAPWCTRYHKA